MDTFSFLFVYNGPSDAIQMHEKHSLNAGTAATEH